MLTPIGYSTSTSGTLACVLQERLQGSDQQVTCDLPDRDHVVEVWV